MVNYVTRVLILTVALFWLLPGQVTFAAKDCYEVEESIFELTDRKALSKVKTQLRLHLKDFKKEGSDYEGQFDIACLIGLYMSIGEPTGVNVLERFNKIADWGKTIFGDKKSSRKYMNQVWHYKASETLLDQEREFGYSNSEWVISALAENLPQIDSAKLPAYSINHIKDDAWCGASKQSRRDLDKSISTISNLVSYLDNWQYLKESRYDKARSQFESHSVDLSSLCGETVSITSDYIGKLRIVYAQKADSFTTDYWKTFVSKGQVGDAEWGHLLWLNPKCGRQPSRDEKHAVSGALQ